MRIIGYFMLLATASAVSFEAHVKPFGLLQDGLRENDIFDAEGYNFGLKEMVDESTGLTVDYSVKTKSGTQLTSKVHIHFCQDDPTNQDGSVVEMFKTFIQLDGKQCLIKKRTTEVRPSFDATLSIDVFVQQPCDPMEIEVALFGPGRPRELEKLKFLVTPKCF